MDKISRFAVPFAALLAVGLALPAWGHNVVQLLSVAEMSERADLVVHGRVRSVDAAWNEDRTRILTTVRLDVISYLAGSGPAEVVIRQVGGRVGDTELLVEGQPRFAQSQQVVVFLERAPVLDTDCIEAYVVMTMAAGMYSVSHDPATGELVLGQDLGGLERVPRAGASAPEARAARPHLLRDLAAEVRRARSGGVR